MIDRELVTLIDVNFHLLTESGRAPPADDFASFFELAALGVVEAGFAPPVASCAGLRNRIAHEHDDGARVHAALAQALDDLPTWMRAIHAWLEPG